MDTYSILLKGSSSEISYARNVEVNSDSPARNFEVENLGKVFRAMDEVMKTPTLVAGAVMPDACPTGDATIPVGGIVVAENAIHPGFHSADICCSVMATNFGRSFTPKKILDAAHSVTHFGRGGRKRSAGIFKYLNSDLEKRIQENPLFTSSDLKKAQLHLGTQGDGNHFLFVGRSENNGGVHVVTHHGSRGFGAGLYQTGMRIAEEFRVTLSPNTDPENAWIPFDTPSGQQYWDALQIIRDWTKLNHEVIHSLIAKKLNCEIPTVICDGSDLSTFWNEHNFVFRKTVDEKELFIHAKGATPIEDEFVPDSKAGFRLIPLNMGQPILIAKGKATLGNLGFAPHGAGRNMSRTAHKSIVRQSGKSDAEIFLEETMGLDVRFFSGNADISELPSAYKNADEVQRQMAKFGLGEIVDRIQPYGCIMAGEPPRKRPAP